MTIEVLVTRKIRDLVQDAAEDALSASQRGVSRVTRGELWSFDVDGDEGADVVRGILEGTTLVVNPNVHRYSFGSWRDVAAGERRLLIRVADEFDARGAAVLRAVRDRCGIGAVRGVQRSVLWAIDLEATDPEAANRLGEEITGGNDAGAGLLANRHAQDVAWEVVTN